MEAGVCVIVGGARLEGFNDRGVSYVLDITAFKNVQKELEKRARELSQSNEELEQFAYIASHDLQEPLRTMAGFANLLEKKYKHKLDQDAVEFIEFIVDAAERMKRLITNLLEYSRITSKPSTHETVHIEDVIAKVLYQLQAKIRQQDIEIIYDPLPVLTANPAHMNQLFHHLLSNAIKFRDEKPLLIKITAREHPSHWLFEVSDTGIGIDMAYATRIFQVFQRLHARGQIRRHRYWTGGLQKNSRKTWRRNLGRICTHRRLHIFLYPTEVKAIQQLRSPFQMGTCKR
jgi:light-regulated signal transduction histidine kinase (bacteriophytochrome)